MINHDDRKGIEGLSAVVPPMPEGAIIDIQVSDLDGATVSAIPNRMSDAPIPGNILALTGPVAVQLTADAFGTHDFFNKIMPAGTYSFAVDMQASGSAQSILVGKVSATSVRAIDTTSWAYFEQTVTLAAPDRLRFLIQHNGAPVDMICRNLQLYEGDTIPAFDEQYDGYLTPLLRLPENALTHGDDDALDTTGVDAIIHLPNYPDPTTFTEGVMIAAVSTENLNTQGQPVVSTEGSGGGWHISFAAGRATAGPVENWSNGDDMLKVAGSGPHIIASRFRSGPDGEASMFFDGIKVISRKDATIQPETVNVLGVFDNPPNPGVPAGQHPFIGRVAGIAVYDRWVSDAEMAMLSESYRKRLGIYRQPAIKPLKVLIAAGDSITQGGGGSGTTYPVRAFEGGLDGWIGVSKGQSGKSVVTYPHWLDVEAMCVSAIRNGHRPVVSIAFGANHQIETAAQRAETLDQMRERWAIFRRMGVETIVHTSTPKDFATWEQGRLIFNDSIRSLSAEYTALCDVGAHPLIGDPATLGGPLWLDHTHYSSQGQGHYGTLFRAVLEGFA